MTEEPNKNCEFLHIDGKKCIALKKLYCKIEHDKKCAFYKEKKDV